MQIELKKMIKLLADCFLETEEILRKRIERAFPGADEEQITTIFHDRLVEVLDAANENQKFKDALSEDIKQAVGNIFEIQQFTNGLIAKVSWHPRKIEEETGGDFGLVIYEPFIKFLKKIELTRKGHVKGILCQAKKKKFEENWRNLTDNQKEAINKHPDCYCILRYEYEDVENRSLKEFKWTISGNNTSEDVEKWLKNNDFPNEHLTKEMIRGLSLKGSDIGTKDPKAIQELIAPVKCPTIIIEIDWKDGFDPYQALIRINNILEIEKKPLIYANHRSR